MSASIEAKTYPSLVGWSLSADEARIAHRVPGRIRICFSEISDRAGIENTLREIPGVKSVKVNPLSGSVLVEYEERHVDGSTLFDYACRAQFGERKRPGTDGSFACYPADCGTVRPLLPPALDKPTGDTVRFGLELLVGILAADVAAVLACLVAAAFVGNRHDNN
jgi:hypothetical protein